MYYIGDTSLLNEEIIQELGVKYSKTNGQILLRWAVQQGYVVIPKSYNKHHIAENSKIFDFELERNDLSKISKLHRDKRYFPNYSLTPVYNWKNHEKKAKLKERQGSTHPRHDEL